MPSTRRRSAVAISGSTDSSPSRSRPSRFSPTWVSDSSLENPRNPAVPLMVWMVRKMLARTLRSPGSFSSTTSSRSRRSRFSWLSTRNSLTISLVLSRSLIADGEGCSAAGRPRFMSATDTKLASSSRWARPRTMGDRGAAGCHTAAMDVCARWLHLVWMTSLVVGCAGALAPVEKQPDFGQYFTMSMLGDTEQAKLEGPRLYGAGLEVSRFDDGYR